MGKSYTFVQSENDEFLAEWASTCNDFSSETNQTDSVALFEDSLLLLCYTAPALILDSEFNC